MAHPADCQIRHWKEGHKESCRKKGQFQIGDKVFCKEARDLPLAFLGLEVPYVITARDSIDQDSWVVKLYDGGEETVSLPSNKLQLMQPSDLRFHGL